MNNKNLEKSSSVHDSWSVSRVTCVTRVTEQESHILNYLSLL